MSVRAAIFICFFNLFVRKKGRKEERNEWPRSGEEKRSCLLLCPTRSEKKKRGKARIIFKRGEGKRGERKKKGAW